MINIAIVGDESVFEIADLLAGLYAARGYASAIFRGGSGTGGVTGDVRIYPLPPREDTSSWADMPSFNILIINGGADSRLETLLEHSIPEFIILNTDEKNPVKAFMKEPSNIITYGFNNKACVTASSITDNGMLFCLQRAISTHSGKSFEEQEFPVAMPEGCGDVHGVMGAVTAALVNDVDVRLR